MLGVSRPRPPSFAGSKPGPARNRSRHFGDWLRLRQRDRDTQPAAVAVVQRDAAVVGLGDLAHQRQPQAGAALRTRPGTFGGVERQQGLGQHRLAHAGATVQHFDAQLGALLAQPQLHRVAGAAGLVRVLDQVQQGLLDLRRVEPAWRGRRRAVEPELGQRRQALQKVRPVHRLAARRGQLGKARIAGQEAVQMRRPLADRGQHGGQALDVAAPGQFGGAVGQR
mmetsp:Transcript_14999/g.28128  ORF Transcript_14999/g.28128 Transcript_14999/m.28128 type:complete len:224 (+) Transcript_14999:320-991(+)